MDNILLCTDHSRNASNAINECLSLFNNKPRHYFLLNTFSLPNKKLDNAVRFVDSLKIDANKSLDNEFERIKRLSYTNYTSLGKQAVFGKTENVINRFINKNEVDLIVLGNQGKSYHTDKLFGSTTEKLLFEVQCPKLIVPNANHQKKHSIKLVIAQEKQLQNKKWWSNVSTLANNQNYTIQLVVIPNKQNQPTKKATSLPYYIAKEDIIVHPFYGKTINEMNESLNRIVQIEKPALLNINFSDEKLARRIIQPSSQKDCICNKTPFIVQAFQE